MAANCPRLRLLDVSESRGKITDESIRLIATNCPQLESLNIKGSEDKITDESLKLFGKRCKIERLQE